jgi:hypothetical protein
MRIIAIGLVMTMAVHAGADEPSTADFLGPETTWGRARLELRDVHGLWGGTDVVVEGSGRVVVRVVERTREERRYETTIPVGEAVALLRRAVEADLLRVAPPQRPGVPDEARPMLVVRNARGLGRSVLKWENDQVPRFDGVRAALTELARAVQARGQPVPVEATEPAWQPFEAISVTVSMFSGRPDPYFELLDDVDVEALREKLRDLPAADRAVQPPGLGYRGLHLRVRGYDRLPREVVVFGGTVTVDGRVVRDARGLEAWLKEQARARGIEVP